MKRWFCAAAIAMAFSASSGAHAASGDLDAQARVLGQCFVMKSTGQDRLTVARWMLTSMASAPQMSNSVTVDASRKTDYDLAMANLFTRLMTVDCLEEARPLFVARSQAGFETAGEALGRIAMQELLTNKEAEASLGAYTKYLKEEDFAALRE